MIEMSLQNLVLHKPASITILLFTSPDWTAAQLALYLVGKFGIAISFDVMYIYTSELFPTSVRGASISISHLVGRIAAILAPQTPLMVSSQQTWLIEAQKPCLFNKIE